MSRQGVRGKEGGSEAERENLSPSVDRKIPRPELNPTILEVAFRGGIRSLRGTFLCFGWHFHFRMSEGEREREHNDSLECTGLLWGGIYIPMSARDYFRLIVRDGGGVVRGEGTFHPTSIGR